MAQLGDENDPRVIRRRLIAEMAARKRSAGLPPRRQPLHVLNGHPAPSWWRDPPPGTPADCEWEWYLSPKQRFGR